jgi:hypothetical protein
MKGNPETTIEILALVRPQPPPSRQLSCKPFYQPHKEKKD